MPSASSRGSTKWPAIAVAAASCGLTRCVRPPRPCRPSKLRFEVEAQRSPSASTSGFMPRHIEHPARRHSKPASTKIRSSPSSSASRLIVAEPGTTRARTPGWTCLPATTAAAARRSSIRAFVHEPMKTRSTGDVLHRRARLEAHVGERTLGRQPPVGIGVAGWIRDAVRDGDDHLRVRPPGDLRRELGDIDRELAVVGRIGIGRERAPAVERLLPARRRSAPRAGPRDRRTSCRRARSTPRAHRPRSTCCRSSSGSPSRGRGSPAPCTRARGRRRRPPRACRSRRGSCPSPSRSEEGRRRSGPASSAAAAAAGTASRARARPRRCRRRTRARRTRRAWRCGCRRRRSSFRAASGRARGRSRGRFPRGRCRSRRAARRTRRSSCSRHRAAPSRADP